VDAVLDGFPNTPNALRQVNIDIPR